MIVAYIVVDGAPDPEDNKLWGQYSFVALPRPGERIEVPYDGFMERLRIESKMTAIEEDRAGAIGNSVITETMQRSDIRKAVPVEIRNLDRNARRDAAVISPR